MQAKLIVVASDQQARQFELHLPATIGRSRSSDVTLGHPLISRRHCVLLETDGQVMVRDLNSMNGTFVGDLRVGDEPVPVLPGEPFMVGSVTLRLDYVAPALVSESGTDRASEQPTERATVDAPLILAASDSLRGDSRGGNLPTGDSRRYDAGHAHRPSGLRFDGSGD